MWEDREPCRDTCYYGKFSCVSFIIPVASWGYGDSMEQQRLRPGRSGCWWHGRHGPELSLDPFFSLGWMCWGLNWLLQVLGKDSGIVEMRCAFFHASSSPREVTLPSGVTECDIARGASCVNGTRKKKSILLHSHPWKKTADFWLQLSCVSSFLHLPLCRKAPGAGGVRFPWVTQ